MTSLYLYNLHLAQAPRRPSSLGLTSTPSLSRTPSGTVTNWEPAPSSHKHGCRYYSKPLFLPSYGYCRCILLRYCLLSYIYPLDTGGVSLIFDGSVSKSLWHRTLPYDERVPWRSYRITMLLLQSGSKGEGMSI